MTPILAVSDMVWIALIVAITALIQSVIQSIVQIRSKESIVGAMTDVGNKAKVAADEVKETLKATNMAATQRLSEVARGVSVVKTELKAANEKISEKMDSTKDATVLAHAEIKDAIQKLTESGALQKGRDKP